MKMLKKMVKEISEKLSEVFQSDHLEILARDSKFIRRRSQKINATNFVQMVLHGALQPQDEVKLLDNAAFLHQQDQLQITKQSLDERYSVRSVAYLKKILEQLLAIVLGSIPLAQLGSCIKYIQLLDSTCFRLPDQLHPYYKGYHGSGAKLEWEYELLSGRFVGIDLVGSSTQDLNFVEQHLDKSPPGTLYLRDLGYFALPGFAKMMDQGAYLLSRFSSKAKLYDEKTKGGRRVYKQINLASLIVDMERKGLAQKELWVYVGKDKIRLRLLLFAMPEEQVKRRRKQVIDRAKSHGQQPKAITLAMCKVNAYVTNLSAEQLSIESVRTLYALRWQIELMFKIWKSVLKLSKFGKMKLHRFETMIYAKLILITLCSKVIFAIRKVLSWYYDFELSEIKAFKVFRDSCAELIQTQNWFDFNQQLRQRLQSLLQFGLTFAKKEVKKHKQSPRQVIQGLSILNSSKKIP